MRLVLWVLLVLSLVPASRGSALTEAEICQRMMQEFGFDVRDCVERRAPPTQPQTASPLDPEIRESHIFFKAGGTRLDDAAQLKIAKLIAVLDTSVLKSACIQLIGHSDTSGDRSANRALALSRAETIAAVLRDGLQDAERIESVVSSGETQPLPQINGSNPLNRRVEIRARSCR
ncbi:OmpA family protein [Shimia sp. R10_1]|uniref:OmpA family protein n=1 Tax=Shimia sp. R10_1 TaxID=2821095 RepID=UPI001ADBE512|nr:OmpA family protein [Shimia sp. R10_1]MBO9475422.1 OmpA family protein [Shimia sp. R10_1]